MWLAGKYKHLIKNMSAGTAAWAAALALLFIPVNSVYARSEALAGLGSDHERGQGGESPIQILDVVEEESVPEATVNYSEDWALILVNRTHPIPEGYEVDLMTLSNGAQVDKKIYPSLQAMFDDARAAGLSLFVRDGYRTQEEQQAIMDNKIQEYEYAGNSHEEAVRLAEEWVALPGTSEHQIGIAVDINADNSGSSDDAVYGWLYDNAWKYGFIKRYPEDKTEITHVINEPWHYRYVGKKAAEEMARSGQCLEEYLGEM